MLDTDEVCLSLLCYVRSPTSIMKTFPHLALPRFLLPSSAGQVADVGLLCTVGLSTQDLAVELQILKTLPKGAQSSTCLASYYYLEFLPVSCV